MNRRFVALTVALILAVTGGPFRSAQAETVEVAPLEQAVKDTPTAGQAWADLGLARLQNGNQAGACLAADRAEIVSGRHQRQRRYQADLAGSPVQRALMPDRPDSGSEWPVAA